MISLACIALGIALLTVFGLWLLIRAGARDAIDEQAYEINEEVFETDLRHSLSDISFGRRL